MFVVALLAMYVNSILSNVIVRSYNEVRYVDASSMDEVKRDYFNLEGGDRAATNIFLGVYKSPDCFDVVSQPGFRGIQRQAGGHVVLPVSAPSIGFPLDLGSTCARVYFYRFGDHFNAPSDFTDELKHSDLTSWTQEHMRVSFTFRNEFPYDVSIYWHDELAEEPMLQSILGPHEEDRISTLLGHVFSVRQLLEEEASPSDPIVDYFAVHELTYTFRPANRLESCEMDPAHWQAVFVDPAELNCENMEARFVEFSQTVWHILRIGLNYVQPQMVRPASVSNLGFELRRLPTQTYTWLKRWYDNERTRIEDVESTSGPCMNQRVAPSLVTHITPNKKDILNKELKPILQEWYNGPEAIKLTSIYGIRRYTNGSVLRMHVDTANTHVVSAIINVDQSVDKDWPIVILDHDYNEHSVVMKPGDMLLYESAKLLHGRPDVFIGDHYDNIFIHFQPVSNWNYDWI